MSDLQGREYLSGTFRGSERLLGETVAEKLLSMISVKEIPALDALLVAGDLYDYPDCRKPGGTGDISDALHALSAVTPDTLCVLGNHDILSSPESLPAGIQILDGQTVTLRSGLRVGGVSGIIGDPKRHNRRSEPDFLEIMETVTRRNPDFLLLHQGPEDIHNQRLGDPAVALSLETGFRGLTIFGHTHWPRDFLIDLGDGQAVNVDSPGNSHNTVRSMTTGNPAATSGKSPPRVAGLY
ncbi:metallophosphoesterase family protein [Marinobacter sp. es.048]|uniref:metallophosphoesterase family protein n=1 Tax=Marinobacter sp. es.048 TaxID=1761795 RepID=UPI001552AF7C|nr:metallophosphoesterase [Marinobacter sp. es.048]